MTSFTIQTISGSGAPITAFPTAASDSFDEDDVLDQALRLVADHHGALGVTIGRRAFSPSIAELRQSPLGRDLRLLAAANAALDDADAVFAAADRVRDVLLRPIAASEANVPDWFWDSALGRIMARAERIALGPDGVLTVDDAAHRLQTSPETVLGWLHDGLLPAIPDERSGWLTARAAVERMQRIALVFREDPKTDEVESVVMQPERLTA